MIRHDEGTVQKEQKRTPRSRRENAVLRKNEKLNTGNIRIFFFPRRTAVVAAVDWRDVWEPLLKQPPGRSSHACSVQLSLVGAALPVYCHVICWLLLSSNGWRHIQYGIVFQLRFSLSSTSTSQTSAIPCCIGIPTLLLIEGLVLPQSTQQVTMAMTLAFRSAVAPPDPPAATETDDVAMEDQKAEDPFTQFRQAR